MTDVLLPNFPLRWTAVWWKLMFEKEFVFMWLIIHKGVPKNEWCGHISTKVDVSCPRCGPVMTRWLKFFDCLLNQ